MTENDYISRGMAIARLTKVEVTDKLATITDAKREIAGMPAADVALVVHGQWICAFDEILCSVCKRSRNYTYNDTNTFNYCPNCGAQMDGGDA